MHLFNEHEQLKKYDNIYEIMDDFYQVRLKTYDVRKQYLLDDITKQLNKISNKVKYIMGVLNDKIDLRRKQTHIIMDLLIDFGLDMFDDSYNYLIKMPMDSVSEENVEKIMNEKENKETELNILKSKDIKDIWSEELQRLNTEYLSFVNHSNGTGGGQHANAKKVNKSKSTKSKSGKKMSLVLDDE